MLEVAVGPVRRDGDRGIDPVLSQAAILRGLAPDDMRLLAGRFWSVRVPAGGGIYREGEQASQLFVVLTGKVKIGWRSAHTCEKLLGVLGPSDVFGAESIFDRGPRSGSAIALTDVVVAVIDRDALQACIAGRPHVAEQLMRVLARRLQHTEDLITDLNSSDVAGRTAKQLLHLAQRFGVRRDGQLHLNHDLTQAEIAQLVGASRESVNKTLSDFAQRGWLSVNAKSLTIHQPELLARRAR